jgi:hypothetical protein
MHVLRGQYPRLNGRGGCDMNLKDIKKILIEFQLARKKLFVLAKEIEIDESFSFVVRVRCPNTQESLKDIQDESPFYIELRFPRCEGEAEFFRNYLMSLIVSREKLENFTKKITPMQEWMEGVVDDLPE